MNRVFGWVVHPTPLLEREGNTREGVQWGLDPVISIFGSDAVHGIRPLHTGAR